MIHSPASGINIDALGVVDMLLVQQSPDFFDQAEAVQRKIGGRFVLCLSGHTNGGRVTLAGWAPWLPPGSGHFVAGLYDVPRCRLFVSRWVRTSVLPLLLGGRRLWFSSFERVFEVANSKIELPPATKAVEVPPLTQKASHC